MPALLSRSVTTSFQVMHGVFHVVNVLSYVHLLGNSFNLRIIQFMHEGNLTATRSSSPVFMAKSKNFKSEVTE